MVPSGSFVDAVNEVAGPHASRVGDELPTAFAGYAEVLDALPSRAHGIVFHDLLRPAAWLAAAHLHSRTDRCCVGSAG